MFNCKDNNNNDNNNNNSFEYQTDQIEQSNNEIITATDANNSTLSTITNTNVITNTDSMINNDSINNNNHKNNNNNNDFVQVLNEDTIDIDDDNNNKQNNQNNDQQQQQQQIQFNDNYNINDSSSSSPITTNSHVLSKKKLKMLKKQQRKMLRIANDNNNGDDGSNRYLKERKKLSYWNLMPIDIIEKIFQLLSIKDRHISSQVCPHWFDCFYLPTIWTTLIITDTSFTKRKFNYYLGYQRMIDPFKTQTFLWKFGTCIRRLIIKPMSNFFNLYEFMKILSQFAQHYEPNRLSNVHTLDFTFGCRSISNYNDHFNDDRQLSSTFYGGDSRDNEVIGTGGKLLEALKELMFYLIGLKHLALRDLLLNIDEARYLLDNVAVNCFETLQTLTLINCCKNQCSFLHVGIFINLHTLIISCQHLDEDVLILLASNLSLNNLYIVQTELTRSQGPLSTKIWKKFWKINYQQKIKINLVMINNTNRCQNLLSYELTLQPTLIKSIIYDAPIIRPSCTRLMEIGQLYEHCLECIEFYHLPKYPLRKSYKDRVDMLLIYLSQKCTKLQTIIINDLLSTSTLLLIASYGKNLKRLYVRRNAIRKRFDCIINSSWNKSFIQWLRETSRSYDKTIDEISKLLGFKWIPLSDEQFKRLKPNVCF